MKSATVLVNWDGHGERMDLVWKGVAIKGVDEVLDDTRGVR